MREIPQRQGFCEVSRYGKDPQCLKRPTHVTCVKSRHDGVVRTSIDQVCDSHSGRILDLKRALYVSYGLDIPDMWVQAKKGK